MAKTLVLGSGISALTYLFQNPEAKALAGAASRRGGMFKTQSMLGPQYLWADKFSEKFLQMLTLPTAMRMIRVGIYYKKKLYTPESKIAVTTAQDISNLYALKTRGIKSKSSFMSSGKMTYAVFNVSLETVVNALLKRVQERLIPSSAVCIYTDTRFVQDNFGDMYTYDKLVSTIPAHDFLSMAGFDGMQHLKSRDKMYGVVKLSKCAAWIKDAHKKKLDYVYCPCDSEEWHRVTFTKLFNEDYVVLEYTKTAITNWDMVAADSFFSGTTIQLRGQIVSGKEVLCGMPAEIKFYGRYAEWDHSVKFNDVLRRVVFEN